MSFALNLCYLDIVDLLLAVLVSRVFACTAHKLLPFKVSKPLASTVS